MLSCGTLLFKVYKYLSPTKLAAKSFLQRKGNYRNKTWLSKTYNPNNPYNDVSRFFDPTVTATLLLECRVTPVPRPTASHVLRPRTAPTPCYPLQGYVPPSCKPSSTPPPLASRGKLPSHPLPTSSHKQNIPARPSVSKYPNSFPTPPGSQLQ